jgi:hypothetical protein
VTDARAFKLGRAADWRGGVAAPGPPPVLAKTLGELAQLNALPDAAEAQRALLRTLEYFGAQRSPTGEIDVPTSLSDRGAPRRRLQPDEAPATALRDAVEVLLRQIDA